MSRAGLSSASLGCSTWPGLAPLRVGLTHAPLASMVVLSGSRHPPGCKKPANAQSLYKSLQSQLDGGFLLAALKTTDRRACASHPPSLPTTLALAATTDISLHPAVLRLNPSDALAARTKLQLQIALDEFPAALDAIAASAGDDTTPASAAATEDGATLEEVYCLYKTGREREARDKLAELEVEVGESRAAKLLEAQVVSRCGSPVKRYGRVPLNRGYPR